MQGILEEQLLG